MYLKAHNYLKNLVGENISQEFRLKNMYEGRNYIVEVKEPNELMSRKHK